MLVGSIATPFKKNGLQTQGQISREGSELLTNLVSWNGYRRYGIPDSESSLFRDAVKDIAPQYVRDQTLWLASDTAMVPPPLLTEKEVTLSRTVQAPGQFVLVFPRSYISSICTGYLVSESVYFAPPSWLEVAHQAFKVRSLRMPKWQRVVAYLGNLDTLWNPTVSLFFNYTKPPQRSFAVYEEALSTWIQEWLSAVYNIQFVTK